MGGFSNCLITHSCGLYFLAIIINKCTVLYVDPLQHRRIVIRLYQSPTNTHTIKHSCLIPLQARTPCAFQKIRTISKSFALKGQFALNGQHMALSIMGYHEWLWPVLFPDKRKLKLWKFSLVGVHFPTTKMLSYWHSGYYTIVRQCSSRSMLWKRTFNNQHTVKLSDHTADMNRLILSFTVCMWHMTHIVNRIENVNTYSELQEW